MKVCVACQGRFTAIDWRCPTCGWGPALHDTWPVFAPDLARHNDSFDAESFANLAAFEPRHFWFRARNRLIAWALRTSFPDARRFLEIGCGTGYVLMGIHDACPSL